jgi:hypothetical protein
MESCAASRTARFPQSFRAISPTLQPGSATVFARPGVPERLRVVAGRQPRAGDADLRSVARAARLVDEALDGRDVKALADRPAQGDPGKPADLVRRAVAGGRAFPSASVVGRRPSARCRARGRATARGGAGCRAAAGRRPGRRATRRRGAGCRAPCRAGARYGAATRAGAGCRPAARARARRRAAGRSGRASAVRRARDESAARARRDTPERDQDRNQVHASFSHRGMSPWQSSQKIRTVCPSCVMHVPSLAGLPLVRMTSAASGPI